MKAIKAKLSKFQTVDEYIHGWGLYYYGAGILLPTRKTEPEGTEVSLHIRIATGETVLRGEGIVEEVRTNSDGAPVGMVIRFKRLDARSKELVQQILEHKKESRTSASVAIVEAHDETPNTEELGNEDIGAIAEALDETFDSIFATGAFAAFPDEDNTAPSGIAAAHAEEEGDRESVALPDNVVEPPEPGAALPNGDTAIRRPPTVAAVNELLARLGLSEPPRGVNASNVVEPPSASTADGDAPDDAHLASGAADASFSEEGDVESADPFGDGSDAFGDGAASADADGSADALEFGDDDLPAREASASGSQGFAAASDSAGPTLTHADARHSDEFHAATDRARQEAEAGEAALADAVAEVARSVTDIPVPVKAAPKGLIARFFAWLAGLFGKKS